jgi:hypothetical protein
MRAGALALGLVALLALLAGACNSGGGSGGPQATVPAGATGSNHVLGSPQAPVELIEYADFQ